MMEFSPGCKAIVTLMVFSIALAGYTASAAPSQRIETISFQVSPGDSLVVENDYGRVRLSPSDGDVVEVNVRKIAPDERLLSNIVVVSQKVGTRVFVQAYFYEYEAESVYIEIRMPRYLNAIVWGANAAVEITQLDGLIRAQTLTGFISAEDLGSSASLLTDSGSILYRSTIQPKGDIRLESAQGNIDCRILENLNIRGWIRAGGKISWNRQLELSQGSLERQVGVGGPLLLAASLKGNVSVQLEPSMQSQADLNRSVPDIQPGPQKPEDDQVYDRSRVVRKDSGPELQETTQEEGNASLRRTGYPTGNSSVVTGSSDPTGGYSLKVNVDLVYLNASVRDRYTNRAVPNLTKNDFIVYEDGIEQPIERFDSTEAPFSLLLLLDVSGSTKSYMNLIKEASIEFTRRINPRDRIAVATFNSRTRLVQDFTNDRYEVEEAIQRIKSGGGTAFYDALDTALNRYMRDQEGRKAIVVFSDGVDNQLTGDYSNGSQITFAELYRAIQEEDVLVYTIFLDTEDEHGRGGRPVPGNVGGIVDIIFGRKGSGIPGGWGGHDPAYEEARQELEQIADQTGGRMYAPRDIRDLRNVYGEIADDLRIQYTLGYHSLNSLREGSWRELEVRIKNRKDLAVRSRKGYYGARG